MKRSNWTFGAGAAALVSAVALSVTPTVASEFPSKPIKLMVGFAAGGGTDIAARAIASFLHEAPTMNETAAVVVNRPGGSGMIGAKIVKDAEPDGHMLYVINNGSFMVAHLQAGDKAPVDPLADFQVVGCVSRLVTSLQVPASSPHKTAKELVDAYKASGETLRWATSGAATMHALVGHAFLDEIGVKHQVIPFKGGSASRNAIAAEKVDAAFNGVHTVKGFETKIRNLGVPLSVRDPANPDVPTLGEQGLSAIDVSGPMCVWGPKAMPDATRDKIVSAIKSVFDNKAFQSFLEKNDLAPLYLTPEEGTKNAEALNKVFGPVVAKVFAK